MVCYKGRLCTQLEGLLERVGVESTQVRLEHLRILNINRLAWAYKGEQGVERDQSNHSGAGSSARLALQSGSAKGAFGSPG
jgi:hypothetical protein